MKRIVLVCGVVFCALTSIAFTDNGGNGKNKKTEKDFPVLIAKNSSKTTFARQQIDSVYSLLEVAGFDLSKDVFEKAYQGYVYLLSQNKIPKPGILTIADYSKPSSEKRLYVIDVANARLLFNTYVAHGRNSGASSAESFSNAPNSNKSSLGFVLTGETYVGSKGYSLRLDGLEAGINDNVRSRAVVIHGSSYVDAARARNGVMMGRSFGCPALSWTDYKPIIDEIKGGSLMFMYSDDLNYNLRSQVLTADFEWPSETI